MPRYAVGDRRIDRVLGDVALGAHVVVVTFFFAEPPALLLHLVGRLPCANDHLADAAHGLAVRRHHGERPDIVQDVFGGDRLLANTALRERQIFRDRRIEVVADHQHVEMLIDGVDRERPRGVGR